MHKTQSLILELAESVNLGSLSLREIGVKLGGIHPQNIKHHLKKLLDKGFLRQVSPNKIILVSSEATNTDMFFRLPILGTADCGPATKFADEDIVGYLSVSKNMIQGYNPKNLFAIKASGNSMNKAKVKKTKKIEDGDYVIVNQKVSNQLHNKYVLSVISRMANIKKLFIDEANNQIVLLSESSEEYPPIYIHESDFSDFLINGEVVDVIKHPRVD